MKYEVFLRLIEDDANGQWGLVHNNAFDKGFNSFWDPAGIFHDVFEHYFEDDILPYFKGKYAFQLYGEMCASGHGIAYKDIGIDNFQYRNIFNGRDFTADTKTYLENAVYEEKENQEEETYLKYPLDYCQVPKQNYYSYNLAYWINQYLYWYKENKHFKCLKSLKANQIRNCYIYGYKRAQKIIGKNSKESYNVLSEFLSNWYEITKSSTEYIGIDDEKAYPIKGFKFVVSNTGLLKVQTTIIDKIGNEYPISKLTNY